MEDKSNEKINNNKINQDIELDLKKINILDNTFLNLKMISEIRENDKLYIDHNLLKIDHPYLLQGIIRWYQNYSRQETMEYLDNIVKNINNIYDLIVQKKENNHNKEYDNILQNLLVEINGASKGLANLKLTYREDVYIKSKLDIIIEKLKTSLNRINNTIKL